MAHKRALYGNARRARAPLYQAISSPAPPAHSPSTYLRVRVNHPVSV